MVCLTSEKIGGVFVGRTPTPNVSRFSGENRERVRRGIFYLLDYVTPSENFQIGDRKKKKDMVK